MGIDRHEKRRRKTKAPPFVMLFNYIVDSPAYQALSPVARATLVEVIRIYNGTNNGMLAMPVRRLAERLRSSKDTASRALNELETGGFIDTMRVGTFRRKDRLASEYRLTFFRCDKTAEPPSKRFLKLHGPNSAILGPV